MSDVQVCHSCRISCYYQTSAPRLNVFVPLKWAWLNGAVQWTRHNGLHLPMNVVAYNNEV